MKDKEKQIEEMAKIMCGNDCEECAKESAEFHKQTLEEARNNKCLLKNCAKNLYNAGYRKPEDSVVLSKEEFEILKIKEKEKHWFKTCMTVWEKAKIEGSKETAEKIYTFVNSFGTHNWERFKEFIKQFGVEVEE